MTLRVGRRARAPLDPEACGLAGQTLADAAREVSDGRDLRGRDRIVTPDPPCRTSAALPGGHAGVPSLM
jgi:hypothetical protein